MLTKDELALEIGKQVLADADKLKLFMGKEFIARFPFHFDGENFWIEISIAGGKYDNRVN